MKTLVEYWPLIKKLTLREIKARYKQSFLGFFWVILNPFFQMLIMSFVFSHILRVTNIGVPYPIFLYAGLLPWLLFSNSLTSSMSVFESNANLLKKIYFPREILVFSNVCAKVFDFFLSFIVFFALMLYFNISFSFSVLYAFPVFLLQFLFIYGMGLLLSSFNIFYRDVQYVFNLILTVWFYITPVLYPTEMFPEKWRWIFKINPMAVFINAYRQALLAHDIPKISSLVIGAIFSVALFVISYKIFKRLEGSFADVV